MKKFKRLLIAICCFFILALIVGNICLAKSQEEEDGRPYLVEISRIMERFKKGERTAQIDLSDYDYVTKIEFCNDNQTISKSTGHDYCIKEIDGNLYRFEYEGKQKNPYERNVWFSTIVVTAFVIVGALFFYIYRQIIVPFNQLEQVPYELSKGNLTAELTENKSKYFGKFVWGTNLLRESIEARRERELDLHREKKVLLLSLAHDIKTPLSVIKLNAQALEKGLYKEEDKQKEVAGLVHEKVDEIEKYVNEIIAASKEDFLDLKVVNDEVYLSEIIDDIQSHYQSKLDRLRTVFTIDKYMDCLLYGDKNRLIEVLQNLMENAIKYGDGRKIGISFDREEDCCLITVFNSGEAVRDEDIIHLFDSFFRGSNVKNEKGSGLGLYICRNLMNKMNGDIYVKQKKGIFEVTVVVKMV